MFDVRFSPCAVAAPGITVVSAAGYPKVFVALGNPADSFSTEVHWVPELERSVPHTDNGCTHCHLPMLSKTWLPAQMCPVTFNRDVMEKSELPGCPRPLIVPPAWQRKVVELPPSAMSMAFRLQRGSLFAIVRGLGREKKKVLWRIFEQTAAGQAEVFDVRPHLIKTWGFTDQVEYRQE